MLGGGIMPWLNAKPGEITECNAQCYYIVGAIREVMDSGKPLVCTGDFMRKGWKFQYNPEKHETPEGELKKYLKSLVDRGIYWQYDERKDEYYFQKNTLTP